MNHQPSTLSSADPAAAPNARSTGWRWAAGGVGGALLLVAGTIGFFLVHPEKAPSSLDRMIEDVSGENPHPVVLVRPQVQPLSALALLGQKIFHDPSMSASGRQSCASCHDPARSYGPPDDRDVQLGGPTMASEGLRPPPSLAYLYRQGPFGIGPATEENDNPTPLDQLAQQAQGTARATKSAGTAPAANQMVPSGGLFWDGREDTFMDQAKGPMMNPAEMANKGMYDVAAKLARAKYANDFKPIFGKDILNQPAMLFTEAMSALSRFQVEAQSFHRFDSKYDHWLEGKARLSHAEMRGLRLFNDPAKGNCAGCHLSQPTADGLPPLFTDTEYEALGVPRNRRLAVNRDPRFFDMGLCGPLRADLAKQTQYCGMFLTPTLRNSARRGVYFHNGLYHDLKQVVDFYNLRDVQPGRVYPHDATGKVHKYDDLPQAYRANIDVADQPLDRKPGDRPALTDAEVRDIIAFLNTLNDGDKSAGY
ncbi:c-type cytochrome [Sphingomonas sp. CGMCC 1.13654]|uniref:C-type cytochrome n=1 Tax=Sphingomonas chungangi TaxID=2683589 RepID=A0A838L2V8_9SPHN|nr:cytochrome c peroxidase [Sphingomonas chungangi]MBA2932566.1 c-type cytochrome [Sphingomonas chungangi]MVW56189.1 c-type cytochrome [Sphingomonas chungangi]